jgi:ribosomal protein S18 acetylase RimI-like enzyme
LTDRITIVPLNEDRAEGFRDCLDVVARESLMLGRRAAPPLEQVWAFVAENVAAGHPAFIAWDGQQVLGWCDAIPQWVDGMSHRAQFGMGVRRSHHRQGLGRHLALATLEATRQRGRIARIDLEVRADNRPAIALYQSLGFSVEGRRRMGLCHQGVFFDTLEMGLVL